jgi:small subunit ribosomal protein S14
MAKTSAINRNDKRVRMSESQADKRAQLKAIIMDKDVAPEERFAASLKLAEQPRNGAKIRIRNRCALTGRSRGNFRKFNLCRIMLRNLAQKGELPGVVKSSW